MKLYTVTHFCQAYPSFTTGGIRALIFNAEKNGFKQCIRRIGRRVLIDVEAFYAWVEGQNA